MRRRYSQAGFSLAETLIAVSIFVVVVVPFSFIFISSLQASGQSQHYSTAGSAAQRQIQLLRTIPYGNLDNVPANSYNGGTNLFSNAITVSGNTVYRTTIPSTLLPDPRTELPGGSGTIDFRPFTQANAAGHTVNYAAAIVKITWTEPGRGPMSVVIRTLVSEGGINDV
jgi:Tfp pilus assembly protein PilV